MQTSSLKWKQINEWCLESNQGGYLVTKYMQGGTPLYQAIRKPSQSLLVAGNAKQCMAACEQDNEQPNGNRK